MYLPDLNDNGKPDNIDRDYFFGILSTLREDETREMIHTALQERYEANQGEEDKNVILVTEEWE
jgi:hypothetical protein